MTSTNTTPSEETKSKNERSRVMTAVFIGAIIGDSGVIYLTSHGAKVRDRVDPAVDRIVGALDNVQTVRTGVKSLAVVVLIVGWVYVPNAVAWLR